MLYPNVGEKTIFQKQFKRIPDKLKHLYWETVMAFNESHYVLCAAGLRMLIEGVCDDKEIGGSRENLERKIRTLATLGIPKNLVDNLHSFRFMGNAAIHELKAPNPDDLRLAIEIVEDILNYLYDLDYKLTLLRARQQGTEFVLPEGTGTQ